MSHSISVIKLFQNFKHVLRFIRIFFAYVESLGHFCHFPFQQHFFFSSSLTEASSLTVKAFFSSRHFCYSRHTFLAAKSGIFPDPGILSTRLRQLLEEAEKGLFPSFPSTEKPFFPFLLRQSVHGVLRYGISYDNSAFGKTLVVLFCFFFILWTFAP